MLGLPLLKPDWDLPPNVRAVISTRDGGVSEKAYSSFNLSRHVGDDEEAVSENRMRLETALKGETRCAWLAQVHTSDVVDAHEVARSGREAEADASWTDAPGYACVVTVADCVPVLMAAGDGGKVAAAHAGWRGLAGNVIANAAREFGEDPFTAYVGPCISERRYEIGEEVRESLVAAGADGSAFTTSDGGKLYANLAAIAEAQLKRCGAKSVTSSSTCTFGDPKNFFSARRDGSKSGRFACAVWISPG